MQLAPAPGIRILIPRNGFLQCTVDRKAIRIPPGMVLIISGKSQTRLMPPIPKEEGETRARRLRIIELNASLNGTLMLEDRLSLPTLADFTPSARIAGLFDQLHHPDESLLLTPGSADISLNILALIMVAQVMKTASAPASTPLKPKDGDRLSKLKTLMISHLGSNTSTAAMAAHLGMSRPGFCQWAKITLGQTPKNYLKQLRLERSQELLTQGTDSIEDIAEKTGFSDRFHFDKEFKRRYNVTPSAYRRQAGTTSEVDFLGPALELFRQGNFSSALQSCEKGIDSSRSAITLDQLRYLKGSCLQATGHPQEALMLWHSLRKSSCTHPAGMASCRLLFSSGRYDEATQCLRERYLGSDNEERFEVVKLWMEHVSELFEDRRPQPLRAYLDARRDTFAHDATSMDLAARILMAMGYFEEVLQQCAPLPRRCFQTLSRAGQLDEAVRRYGKQVDALTLKSGYQIAGLWEKALAQPPETPWIDALVLTRLGRPEEAIRRYPAHATGAYLALGRYADLLKKIPPPTYDHIYALHALGRLKELKHLAEEYPELWGEAQIYLDPAVILSSQGREAETYGPTATLLLTLLALNAGKTAKATALIETCQGVDSPDLWRTTSSGWALLLVTVLRGFLLPPKRMQDDLKLILSQFRFHHKQCLWHDAAYLTREITRTQFMKQPFQGDIENRFLIIDAISHDLANRKPKARQAYETIQQHISPYPCDMMILQQFIQWRLSAYPPSI
jgi:AraC-like DNA-binding protein